MMVSDDIYAYKDDGFRNGAFAVEIGLGLGDLDISEGNTYEAVYIEAEPTRERATKTSNEHGIGQIKKSKVYGYYSGYYVCGPFITDRKEWENLAGDIGAISFNEQGEIIFIPHKNCESEKPKLTLKDCLEYVQLLKKYASHRHSMHFTCEMKTTLYHA